MSLLLCVPLSFPITKNSLGGCHNTGILVVDLHGEKSCQFYLLIMYNMLPSPSLSNQQLLLSESGFDDLDDLIWSNILGFGIPDDHCAIAAR